LHALRKTADARKAQQIIAAALPPLIVSLLQPAELDTLGERLRALPEPGDHVRLNREDWKGFLGVFLLVFVSTFPVVIPFLLMKNALPALRVSNAIAIAMLFLTGYAFGRITGRRPWVRGVAMVLLGAALVAITMALGG
jgi:VIT1/CCC1 family predicted Fe2+/Mn2+ transporter